MAKTPSFRGYITPDRNRSVSASLKLVLQVLPAFQRGDLSADQKIELASGSHFVSVKNFLKRAEADFVLNPVEAHRIWDTLRQLGYEGTFKNLWSSLTFLPIHESPVEPLPKRSRRNKYIKGIGQTLKKGSHPNTN